MSSNDPLIIRILYGMVILNLFTRIMVSPVGRLNVRKLPKKIELNIGKMRYS